MSGETKDWTKSLERWRIIPFRNSCAYENMAIDEAIFRENQRVGGPPTLRFYGWHPSAVSLGYFQDSGKEVNEEFCRSRGIDIVRRLTGGKAVFHQNDLTYSLVAREDNPLFPAGIIGTYLIISQCIINGLSQIGIEARMETGRRLLDCDDLKSFCFSVPSQYEILVNGRKICGSAQARSNGSFLQHGSLLLDFDPDMTCSAISRGFIPRQDYLDHLERSVTSVNTVARTPISAEELNKIMRESFKRMLSIDFSDEDLTAEEEILKNKLMKEKYMTDQWNISAKTSIVEV